MYKKKPMYYPTSKDIEVKVIYLESGKLDKIVLSSKAQLRKDAEEQKRKEIYEKKVEVTIEEQVDKLIRDTKRKR